MPAVTVLMSVYNGRAYLREALDSLLAQTFTDFELLIVDDGSTDGSAEIVASCSDSRIRLLRNGSNLGLTRSLNLGLHAASAELIARHDADDVSEPTRLARQVNFLTRSPETALLGTQAYYINARGRRRDSGLWHKATTVAGARFQALFQNPFFHTSVMFRRAIVRDVLGGYDEILRTNQDFELWSRLLARFRAHNLSDVLVGQRSHGATLSSTYRHADWRRLEPAFRRNVETAFGPGHRFPDWPERWLRASSPEGSAGAGPDGIHAAAVALRRSYCERKLAPEELADVRRCFACCMMLTLAMPAMASAACAVSAVGAALRTSPPVALATLPRAIAGFLRARTIRTPTTA
jgi:glycosyltransferase involved in cell wall biosynthesis